MNTHITYQVNTLRGVEISLFKKQKNRKSILNSRFAEFKWERNIPYTLLFKGLKSSDCLSFGMSPGMKTYVRT